MQVKPFSALAAGAIAILVVAGCSKGEQSSSSSTTTTTSTSTAAPDTSATTTTSTTTTTTTKGDAVRGKSIFTSNCASCHGATGTEGGVGPSLKNEKSKKNFDQTVAWIKNPQPPMPKLYPSPLSEKDVEDVAAYVQTL